MTGAVEPETDEAPVGDDDGVDVTIEADEGPDASPLLDVDRWTGGAIGRYEVLAELGAGGMASVYLARLSGAQGVRRFFAIKRIHPHLARDRRFVEMFVDEARLASALQHHNVAQMIELGSDGRSEFLVMEYLHGEHFMTVMSRAFRTDAPLSTTVAAYVVAEAAAGLHHAHEARDEAGSPLELVHRDVTPHNVFVTYEGGVKITDFGIAKAKNRLTQTQTGSLKGKLAYMSPEQADRREVDRRTDVFALGIILYEATTRRRLFKAPTEVQTIMRVTSCKVPPPTSVIPGYPPELERIVLRALARRPADRYATADEMVSDLRAFIAAQPGGGRAPADLRALMDDLFANERLAKDERLRAEPTPTPSPANEAAEGRMSVPTLSAPTTARALTPPSRAPGPTRSAGVWPALALVVVGGIALALWRPWERPPEPAATPTPPALVEAPPGVGVLRVDSIPPGAALLVDGVPRGTTPALIEAVPVGAHTLALTLDGYLPLERTIEVTEPRTETSVPLEPVPVVAAAAPAPIEAAPRGARPGGHTGTATFSLVTLPWAQVWINGTPAGETPIYNRTVPAGRIVVRLRREGRGPTRTFTFRASAGDSLRERIEL